MAAIDVDVGVTNCEDHRFANISSEKKNVSIIRFLVAINSKSLILYYNQQKSLSL